MVNRGEMISRAGLPVLLGLSLGLRPMYWSAFKFLLNSSKLDNLFLFGHRDVPWIVRS